MHTFMNLICSILVIIGAINWGLVGAFNLNLVSVLFGPMSILSRIIYIIIGIAGICDIFMFKRTCTIIKNNNK